MTSRILQGLVKQLGFVIIIVLLGGKRSDGGSNVWFITGGILFFTVIRGLITYFRSYYSVQDQQLIVEKGLFNTSKITIPLDRIQAVDFDQTPVHKLVNLVKVNITTAGSDGEEANIEAITLDKANELRKILLSQSASQSTGIGIVDQHQIATEEPIIQHSFVELLKIGFAENHLNSALIIFAFMASIFQRIQEAGILDLFRRFMPDAEAVAGDFTAIGAGLIIIMAASILISLVKTMLLYFDLKLVRQDDSFRLSHGLLNTRQFTAKDSKIQVLGWERTWLQGLFDYSTLFFKQASTRSVSAKKRLSVPGFREHHLGSVIEDLDYEDKLLDQDWQFVTKYYKRYHIRNLLIFLAILTGIGYLSAKLIYAAIPIALLGIYRAIGIFKRYQKLQYKVDRDHIQLRGGTFGSRYDVLKTFKIQAVTVRATLYQRRRDLADMIVSTAAGDVRIPMIYRSKADQMRDEVLYHIESSIAPWM